MLAVTLSLINNHTHKPKSNSSDGEILEKDFLFLLFVLSSNSQFQVTVQQIVVELSALWLLKHGESRAGPPGAPSYTRPDDGLVWHALC